MPFCTHKHANTVLDGEERKNIVISGFGVGIRESISSTLLKIVAVKNQRERDNRERERDVNSYLIQP